MRAKSAFKPGVDRLESREVLSTTALASFAPHFVVKGQPPHVFPTGPGLFVPLGTSASHGVTPAGSVLRDPSSPYPVATTWRFTPHIGVTPVGSVLTNPSSPYPVATTWNLHR